MESDYDEGTLPESVETFWSQYEIPFDFETAYKYRFYNVDRGETTPHDELERAVHLFALEGVFVPRMFVSAESYLCEDDASYHHNEHGPEGGLQANGAPRPVTCTRCLKRMERWKTDE